MNVVRAGERYSIVRPCVLMFVLMLHACTTPDRRYDLDKLYEDYPVPESTPDFDLVELPAPELKDPAPLPSIDQGRVALSIEQAVLLTLRRNRELQVERFTPVIVGAFEQLERGVFDPELFADLVYSEETASETARSTGERFDVESVDDDIDIGLRQRLPTGTILEALVSYERSTSNRTPEQQAVRGGLTVTQSLLEGFGPAVNLVDIR
jgi:outer membrane protein